MRLEQPSFKPQYENFIGGQWRAPVAGRYFDNLSPVDGAVFTRVARSDAQDIELALDAAHAAAPAWGQTAPAERSRLLNRIADRMEEHLELLARVETWDNGKPVRETLAADLPLAIDHFRYFAGVIRADAGSVAHLDASTVSMEVHEPLGVVAQIIPWNFPLLMAAWKLAPALAAGNCVVLKPAEQTPVSILVLMELIQDLLPPGVLNVVNGFGLEAGQPLASSPRVAKVAFTGETSTGKLIMQYAAQNVTRVTLELGGKSPNIFLASVVEDDALFDKAVEGFVMFALNQGEVCTCPSRALVQSSIYERFMARVLERVAAIVVGHPLDTDTMLGAQASREQFDKIMSYVEVGRREGAEVLAGGNSRTVAGLEGGFYIEPTVLKGHNQMRVFQEEIFGPVASVTTFDTPEEAIQLANDTVYGLGAAVWTRDLHQAHQLASAIQAGRVWVNCYHLYPAHASFGGYKQSGIGRETHAMVLDHYRNTKNVLISYSKNALGFF